MTRRIMILMADDDAEDRMLVEEAWEENLLDNDLRFVEDGEQLIDYLKHRGKYADPSTAPRPDLILLDLNMPRKDGREALAEIKADPDLRGIPIVALTSSRAEEDVVRSYNLGVSSYMVKPVTFEGLVEALRTFGHYWLQIVTLPPNSDAR